MFGWVAYNGGPLWMRGVTRVAGICPWIIQSKSSTVIDSYRLWAKSVRTSSHYLKPCDVRNCGTQLQRP